MPDQLGDQLVSVEGVPGRWVDAGDLRVGDVLVSRGGGQSTVESLDSAHTPTTVYHINVEDLHNYAVGDAEWLVHNGHGKNLNSNDAVSEFGLYEISVNGVRQKVGKADMLRVTQSSGLPTRLHQQVRRLSDEYGSRNVSYTLTQLGSTTTRQAKIAETARLQKIFDLTGIVPEGNLKSFFPELQ